MVDNFYDLVRDFETNKKFKSRKKCIQCKKMFSSTVTRRCRCDDCLKLSKRINCDVCGLMKDCKLVDTGEGQIRICKKCEGKKK